MSRNNRSQPQDMADLEQEMMSNLLAGRMQGSLQTKRNFSGLGNMFDRANAIDAPVIAQHPRKPMFSPSLHVENDNVLRRVGSDRRKINKASTYGAYESESDSDNGSDEERYLRCFDTRTAETAHKKFHGSGIDVELITHGCKPQAISRETGSSAAISQSRTQTNPSGVDLNAITGGYTSATTSSGVDLSALTGGYEVEKTGVRSGSTLQKPSIASQRGVYLSAIGRNPPPPDDDVFYTSPSGFKLRRSGGDIPPDLQAKLDATFRWEW